MKIEKLQEILKSISDKEQFIKNYNSLSEIDQKFIKELSTRHENLGEAMKWVK
jgi:hypothetical protein